MLRADIAGVKGAGHGGIPGAFDDGAAVGEDGDLEGRHAEAQEEFIAAHLGHGGSQARPLQELQRPT